MSSSPTGSASSAAYVSNVERAREAEMKERGEAGCRLLLWISHGFSLKVYEPQRNSPAEMNLFVCTLVLIHPLNIACESCIKHCE